jgi:hypothetical protein
VQFAQQTWAKAADALAGNIDEPERQVAAAVSIEQDQVQALAEAGDQGEPSRVVALQPDEPSRQSPAAVAADTQSQLPPAPSERAAEQTSLEEELETFWLKLLDEVSSMPSLHSILSNYPFPLSLDQKEFTIGVNNDMWRNNVEKRMEPIKTACERVLGRQIAIKVKVVSSAPSRLTPRERAGAATARRGPESSTAEENEDPEPPDHTARVVQRPSAAPADQQVDGSRSTLVREADQLFQGPGSRRIT